MQAFGVVALGVDTDRHQLHFFTHPAAQLLLHLAHDRRHHRAHRGATGVDKAHDHQAVGNQVLLQTHRHAVLVEQLHIGKTYRGFFLVGLGCGMAAVIIGTAMVDASMSLG